MTALQRLWVLSTAYQVRPASCGVVAACVVSLVTLDQAVGIGFAPIRTNWFVLLAVLVCCAVPLAPRWGELEPTLVRVRTARALRAVWFAVASLAALVVVWRSSPDLAMVGWFAAVATVAVTLSSLAPRAALPAVLAAGSGTILLDHVGPGYPVSEILYRTGPAPFVMLLVVTLVGYVVGRQRPVD